MDASQQRAYVLERAQKRTLAADDPHWQDVKRRARQGVSEDGTTRDEVMQAGGPNGGSVNKLF